VAKSAKQIRESCSTCDDLGVVVVAETDPIVTIPCPGGCDAGRERQRLMYLKAMERAKIPPLYASMTFDSFNEAMKGQPEKGKLLAFAAAVMFAQGHGKAFTLRDAAVAQGADWFQPVPDNPSNGLMLTGDYGMGKTGLAVAAVNTLMSEGESALYVRVADLIDDLQSTYRRDYEGPSLEQKLYIFITVPVLVLDEFEVQNYTADRLELIEKIIRGRHQHGLPLLATTNIPDAQAFSNAWGQRIGDIVATAHWVRVAGVKMRNTSRGVFSY
jgi:DNA replication protein DnaC